MRPGGIWRELLSLRVLVVIGVGALLVYAIVQAQGGSNTDNAFVINTLAPITTFPPAAAFVSPHDGADVTNPVTVRMAVGGVLLQQESEPAAQGKGHLHVIIDGDTPPAGETVPTDATHIDLADAGHTLALPPLPTGAHKLTVVFTTSDNVVTSPVLSQTISVNVTG
jgi:hypothetical protein